MEENQSLEINIKAVAKEAINNLHKLTDEVFKLGNSVEKVSTKINKEGQVLNSTITTSEKTGKKLYSTIFKLGQDGSIERVTSNVKKLGNSTKKTTTMFGSLGKSLSLVGLYYGVKRLSTTFLTWMNESTDRTEQLNLFNVVFKNIEKNGVKTFSTLGQSATKFQYTLNEAFGTNMTETLKYQALFQSMAENASIPDAYSKIMSETMTKFTYDLASLYNKSESDVAEALRAGVYAGQTKPLRSYGIDVTQSTMKPILESLGIIDRSVSDLSQGEKEILRYIAALEQAKVAMGDYADTIESPANQMKVFKNLLVESKVAITSLFMGTFAKILPYANALLMVVKEVSKAIADIFGIQLSDYNTGIASTDDAYSGLSDSIDGATDSLKELKRQTLGFDQINNINENNSKLNPSEVTGGIDQRLLDAIKGYDNGMDKVRMKATEIRDRIMEWLGFTKTIDDETGEVKFKLTKSNTTMGKIINSMKKIVKYGKEIISKVFNILKNDFDNGSFGKYISSAFSGIANLLESIGKSDFAINLLTKLLETFIGFKVVVSILNPIITLVESVGTKVGLASTSINKLLGSLSNIGVVVGGLMAISDSVTTLKNEGFNFISVGEGIIGTIATVGASMATLTPLLGTTGTIFGAIIGLMSACSVATRALMEDEDSLKNRISDVNDVLIQYEESMIEADTARQSFLNQNLGELEYYKDLYAELQLITDANGRIKTGYESRANFIVNELANALGIEISIVDGQIQKYDELEQSIYDVIEAKRAEYLVQANTEKYNLAMDERVKLEQAYADAIKNTKDAYKEATPVFEDLQEQFKLTDKELQNFIDTGSLSLKNVSLMTSEMTSTRDAAIRMRDAIVLATESEEEAGLQWANNQKIIGDYENALVGLSEKNYDVVSRIYNDTVNYQGKTKDETIKNYSYSIESQKKYLEDLKKNKYNYDEDYLNTEKIKTEAKIKQLEEERDLVQKELELQNQLVKNKTLEGVNEQLSVFKNKKYEFKETANEMMQLYVDGIESGRPISVSTMEKLVNGTIQKIKDKKIDAKTAGEYLIDGVNLGIKNQNKQSSVFSAIANFGANLLAKFKSSLKEHSPSKATQEMGMYFLDGFNIGFDKEKKETLSNIKSFGSKIIETMDFDYNSLPSDLSLDVNKYIDYGQINGSLNSNINANVNGEIARNIGNYVARAINSRPIQVDINATTDQGTILETAVNGINQKTKQTGVCPIIIPM